MAINLEAVESPTREQRLGSITGYDGDLRDLVGQGCAGCLVNRKRGFQTTSLCAHTFVVGQLAGLVDAVVIDHAPIGCSASQIGTAIWHDVLPPGPDGRVPEHARVVTTRLDESDAIFGATDKLKQTVRAAFERHHPGEIYITSSCVSAIIGEDIAPVAQELTAELGIPVQVAAAEGFRSKVWSTGFDSYGHAASKVRFGEKSPRNNTITTVGFSAIGKQFVAPLFDRLGLEIVCLTDGATREEYQLATGSVAVWGQCSSQANYICTVLEQRYGVRYLQNHLPYGGVGFERFFRDLAALVGKPEAAEEVISQERAKYADQLAELRGRLAGKRAFVALGSGFAYEYTRMLGELGVEVVHAVSFHYDPILDPQLIEPHPSVVADVQELKLNVETSINDAQAMENYLLVKKHHPDFLLSRAHETTTWAIRTGIPALEVPVGFTVIGYRGLVALGTSLVKLGQNPNLVRKLGQRYRSPFTKEYEALDPFNFYTD